ncbi:MAG: HhH-GPD-type base excision DNA repair protein [Acidimicrobiia bacterium]|nr:HhH-GPD-type base excision DNA repair protein [Acidimicrobiia bacterium]
MQGSLRVTGDAEADDLVCSDPFALVVALLLDQQVPLTWAFRGPLTLQRRLGTLDPGKMSRVEVEEVVEAACRVPAIHRFPAVMARRIHAAAVRVVEVYSGDAERIWSEAHDADDLHRRLLEFDGFGDEKAKILIAILGKRYGVRPSGWAERSAPFSDTTPRTAADIDGPDALAAVNAWKRSQRAAGKGKQDG